MATSAPATVSPLLREFGRRLEPILSVASRGRLARLLTDAEGTAGDGLDDRRRRRAQDWLLRTWLVRWLDVDDRTRAGARLLEPLGPIRDPAQAEQAARAVLGLWEERSGRWARRRVDEWVSRPTSDIGLDVEGRRAQAARSLARDVVEMVVRQMTGDPVASPVRENLGDGWASAQDAVWAVVPPDRWSPGTPGAVRELAGESIRELAEALSVPAALRAHRGWDAAWVSSGDVGAARAAAVRAAPPPVRDPNLWASEPARPAPRRRGDDRREEAALRRAPETARIEAVCSATLGVLHERLHPTVRALQESAVELVDTMVRP